MRVTAKTPAPRIATAPTVAAMILPRERDPPRGRGRLDRGHRHRRHRLGRRRWPPADRTTAGRSRPAVSLVGVGWSARPHRAPGAASCRRRSRVLVLLHRPPPGAYRRACGPPVSSGRGPVPAERHVPSSTCASPSLVPTDSSAPRCWRRCGPPGTRRCRSCAAAPGAGEIGWDPRAGGSTRGSLRGLDAVVNLAGAGIGDKRWSDEYKRRCSSRGPGRPRCSPTRSPGSTAGRRRCCRDRRSASTAIAATRSSTSRRRPAPASSPTSPRRGRRRTAPAAAAGRARRAPAHRHRAGRPGRRAAEACCRCSRSASAAASASGRQWMSWIALDDEVAAIVHLLTATSSGR